MMAPRCRVRQTSERQKLCDNNYYSNAMHTYSLVKDNGR